MWNILGFVSLKILSAYHLLFLKTRLLLQKTILYDTALQRFVYIYFCDFMYHVWWITNKTIPDIYTWIPNFRRSGIVGVRRRTRVIQKALLLPYIDVRLFAFICLCVINKLSKAVQWFALDRRDNLMCILIIIIIVFAGNKLQHEHQTRLGLGRDDNLINQRDKTWKQDTTFSSCFFSTSLPTVFTSTLTDPFCFVSFMRIFFNDYGNATSLLSNCIWLFQGFLNCLF